jgi:hypothetical protein
MTCSIAIVGVGAIAPPTAFPGGSFRTLAVRWKMQCLIRSTAADRTSEYDPPFERDFKTSMLADIEAGYLP